MPVVTRSQSRKLQQQQEQQQPQEYATKKSEFIARTKILLSANHEAIGLTNRISTATEVFKYVNAYLPELLKCNNEFNRLCLVVFNKAHEFQTSYTAENGWPSINRGLVDALIKECEIAKQMVAAHINSTSDNSEYVHTLRLKIQTDKPFVKVPRRSPRIARK